MLSERIKLVHILWLKFNYIFKIPNVDDSVNFSNKDLLFSALSEPFTVVEQHCLVMDSQTGASEHCLKAGSVY